MQAIVLRSPDHEMLDREVAKFAVGMPLLNEENQRIGTVLRMWREGNNLMAELEAVPGDLKNLYYD